MKPNSHPGVPTLCITTCSPSPSPPLPRRCDGNPGRWDGGDFGAKAMGVDDYGEYDRDLMKTVHANLHSAALRASAASMLLHNFGYYYPVSTSLCPSHLIPPTPAHPPPPRFLITCTKGHFERAISMFRTSYSFVAVSRADMPPEVGSVLWFSQHSPHAAAYTPLYPNGGDQAVPAAFSIGSLHKVTQGQDDTQPRSVQNYLTPRHPSRAVRTILPDVHHASYHHQVQSGRHVLALRRREKLG